MKNNSIRIMKFIKKIYIVPLVFFYMNSTNAESFCLNFSSDFLSLLRCQEKRYLLELSKKSIDQEIKRVKNPGEYLIKAMCYYGIPKNLGEENALGEKAYVYTHRRGSLLLI